MEEVTLIKKLIEGNPFAKLLNFEMVEFTNEKSVATMVVREEFMNINGQIHGGILFSFCDSIAGLTSRMMGGKATTIDGTIHYLTNVHGGILRGECICRRRGRKVSVFDVSIYTEEEKLLCISTITMYHAD